MTAPATMPRSVAGRVPPHDLEAEAAVLAACLLNAAAIATLIAVGLRREHFYADGHALIWDAIVDAFDAGKGVDVVVVATSMRARGTFQRAGGAAYLAQLADATPSVANVGAHVQIVIGHARVRRVIAACQVVAAEGYEPRLDVDGYCDRAETAVFTAADVGATSRLATARDAARSWVANMTAIREGRVPPGLPTGFDPVDDLTAGLHDGDAIVVAGRPGMGKTAWALCVALNVAGTRPPAGSDDDRERAVALFSLEMPLDQITARLTCILAEVDLLRVRKNTLSDVEYVSLLNAAEELGKLPIWIEDSAGITLTRIRAELRRIKVESERAGQRLSLVVIDYLQLMGVAAGDDDKSRNDQVSAMSRGVKSIAKDFGVPVILLSQLSRGTETRRGDNKRPQLSDLRDSGAIEQDADAVLFVYRADYYGDVDEDERGIAEIIVAKQRNGPAGRSARLRYYPGCTKFANAPEIPS